MNVFTGVKYRDDRTIMAWELMNEPKQVPLGPRACSSQAGRSAGSSNTGGGPNAIEGLIVCAPCHATTVCRCPGCFNNTDQDVLLEWTAEMSAFLKCIDPNHLVSGEGLERACACT